jgi:predicted sugar kinase
MEHCNKEKAIEKISKELHSHIEEQKKADVERLEYREARKMKDEEISEKLHSITTQISELIELNKDVKDFKTAWRVGKKLGLGLAAFITVGGIIAGGIMAVKSWIKN